MTRTPPQLGPDPLVRDPVRWQQRLSVGALITVVALVMHVAATGAISGASWLIGLGDGEDEKQEEPVKVAIIETRSEPPPLPVVVPEPEVAPEAPAVVPEPVVEPKTAPKPKSRRQRTPPPPDPIDRKPTPPPPADAKPVRRTVGLNLEATVTGGDGPSFATGNSRMGQTDRKASDPAKIDRRRERAAATPPPPPSPNQAAQSIPGAKVKLVKPKRKERVEPVYPALLRDRGIEGVVVVRVRIDAAGAVTKVDVVAASAHAAFNAAAKAAALKERFRPATKNGAAVPFSLSFSYRFRLNG